MGEQEASQNAKRIPRFEAVDRGQMILHAIDVERLVGEDHPARAIWELTGRLDLSAFYEEIEAVEGAAGRPAWDPRLLISLWVYAYSEGVSSAREISRLCGYNPAYQWLSGMKEVNYHTLSDFRVAHRSALSELFIQMLGVLSSEGLITLQRVMHDGTKIRAHASSGAFRREGRIQAHLELAREQVRLLEDACEEEISARAAKARQRASRERVEKLELALKELEKVRADKSSQEEKENVRVSMTDPQARIMKQPDGGFAPSYNAQISTDAASGAIVGAGLTQAGCDYHQLIGAVDRIKQNMGCKPKQVVTDGGFTSRENILAMNESGVDLIGPIVDSDIKSACQMRHRGVAWGFRPEAFIYDAGSDAFICPAGKVLKYEWKENLPGRTNYRYRARPGDCRACPFKHKCCPANTTRGRMVVRGVVHPVVAEFIEKMHSEEAKSIYKTRGAVAEFTFAWLKTKIGLRQFALRGLVKAETELLWACLSYNVKQWIRLSWKPRLAAQKGI